MLPDPVNIAAQVLAIAIPKFARKAYKIARAVELCEVEAILICVLVNGSAGQPL